MKQIASLLYFIFIIKAVQCQEIKKFEFVGTLQLSNAELITYKLNFKELSDGTIEGSSVTDLYGNDRTEAKINGRVDPATKKISFFETQNLNTKSSINPNDFCFVHLNDATIKTVKGKSIIQGSFIGKYQNGKNCAKGYIYLMSAVDLDDMSKQIINSKHFKNQDSLQAKNQKIDAFTKRTGIAYLQKNEELKFASRGDEIQLQVWDGGREIDMDQIALYINEELLIERIEISDEKKLITIPFTKSIIVKIVAINEGMFPPCTVNFLVKTETDTTPVIASLKKGEKATILIDKK